MLVLPIKHGVSFGTILVQLGFRDVIEINKILMYLNCHHLPNIQSSLEKIKM